MHEAGRGQTPCMILERGVGIFKQPLSGSRAGGKKQSIATLPPPIFYGKLAPA